MVAQDWARDPFSHIVAINNAWRLRSDWDVIIHPEDFPAASCPEIIGPQQRRVTADEYVPLQNDYGGFVYAGGTMAFTAGYWALGALRPAVLAFLGCDMIYPRSGNTHFYGCGTADPLRADVTLRSLEAKSARLALYAARQGCRVVRLSQGESRLVFPPARPGNMMRATLPSTAAMPEIEQIERALGYYVSSGRYWEHESRFEPEKIDHLDQRWLEAYSQRPTAKLS